jgi:hypothetical protein
MSFSRVQITSIALSAAAVLALPAGTAVAKKKAPKYPVVTKVTPMKAGVGDLMTISGKGFRSGKNKNTIVFKRAGQRAVFVKAEHATTTKLSLHVPLKLQAYMTLDNGQPAPSVFAIRVISTRFGQKFTGKKLSPTIGPAGTGITAPGVTPPSAYEQCLNAATANPGGDEDKDSLSNGLENSLNVRTDPCRADTDTDGLSDGWEYQSALDLNSQAYPYPGKKPWPNALDPTDINSDFDGDGLLAWQEFQLWQYVGSPTGAGGQLGAYSDGNQNTGGPVLTAGNPALQAIDLTGDGELTDDERDADNDGLSNMIEFNNAGTQNWWSKGPYRDEKPYFWRTFAETSATDPDSDGDGVLDGADDQDADGYDNYTEMEFNFRRGEYVQPFNPCLPDPNAPTCSRYVPLDDGSVYPPFDENSSSWQGSLVPLTWPAPTPAQSLKWFWNGSQGPQNTPDGHTTAP